MDPMNSSANPAAVGNGEVVLLMPSDQPQPQQQQHKPTAEAPKAPQNTGKLPPTSSSHLPPLKIPDKPAQTSSTSRPPLPPASAALLRRSSIAKPKSRFVEPPTPPAASSSQPLSPAPAQPTPAQTPRPASTPADADDDDEIFRSKDGAPAHVHVSSAKYRRRAGVSLELAVLVLFLALLVVSLLVRPLKKRFLWGLEIWKWCVMVITVFSGHLVTHWLIAFVFFLIEHNFLLRNKVLYFIFGLKRSVQACIWAAIVLIAWSQLFDRDLGRPPKTARILNYVSRFLASMLITSIIWLINNFSMKFIAASFHRKAFFDRIQESLFQQYVLQALSGPPLMELSGPPSELVSLSKRMEEKGKPEVDVAKLRRINQEKVSAWTMTGLVSAMRSSKLSTISQSIESFGELDDTEQKDKEINSEWEAKVAAKAIFKNVARPGNKYIEEPDLLRFFSKEETALVLPMFEGASETGKIKKSALKTFVVKAYLDRKSLALSLNDTKTAVSELRNLVRVVIIIIMSIITLVLMGIATTKVLVVISSQLLVVAFIFGNACKTVFEAIIFVFIMHPFDVGDRCVIDGIQMTVEEMNILTTVLLKNDNEKVYYPNSVLSTKPISNFYRSPNMFDIIDFAIDVKTSATSIGALRSRIKGYLESKPTHWHPIHTVILEDILDVNKINMSLKAQHTMNFQNMWEKNIRRSELVMELKRIFEEMSIRYELLPQKVELSYAGPNPLPISVSQGR